MARDDGNAADPLTELQDMLRDGRKRPLNFAMLKTKDGVVIKAHPLKSAEVMFREAKAAGGMPAISCLGTLTVEGKMMCLAATTDEVPRNLPKLAKKQFRDLGLPCKVVIRLPGGGTLDDEEDGEDGAGTDTETVAPGIEAPAEDGAGAADMTEARARIDALAARLTALGPDPADMVSDLGARLDEAVRMADAGEAEALGAHLDRVEADLARAETEAQLRAQLRADFDRLAPDLAALRSRGAAPVVRKADQIAAMVTAELPRDLRKAGQAVQLLASHLRAEMARLPAAPADATGTPSPAAPAAGPGPSDAGARPDGGIKETLPGGAPPPVDATQPPPETPEMCFAQVGAEFGPFWDQVCEAPPRDDAARMAEHAAITAQQDRIRAFFQGGLPTGERLAALMAEMAKLSTLVRTAQQIAKIAETQPETATRMREAMTGFDAELGAGATVTPEMVTQLQGEADTARVGREDAQAAIRNAQAMAPGPQRDRALAAAQARMATADAAAAAADRKLVAAQGKQGLTAAMGSGPLSPNAPNRFSDASAAEFVSAFRRAPTVASFAVEQAATAPHPDAIAQGMGMLCDRVETGFAASDGRRPPDGFNGQAYAENLIRGAGGEGGDFMAQAGAYIGRGDHLVSEPIPSPSGSSANGRERDRTNFMSRAMIGADGTLDPSSPAAQTALGHLRFSPDVIDEPTPSLNAHVVRMAGVLDDDTRQAQAQGILDGIDAPRGGAQALLGRALGKPPADVTAEDARQQTLAALLTPVHQGNVGSCFATAGVRRMSETDPLESMARYAELAETGVFRPRNGEDPIPAVMSFPADENPLIRSMEYSAATVMAGMEQNSRSQHLQRALNNSVSGLMDPVGDRAAFLSDMGLDNWRVDEPVIRQTLVDSFSCEYDATRSTPVSADGSSSAGIYVLVQLRPSRRVIDTKALFVEALTERVLTAIGEPADSEKGKKIADHIKSEDYLNTLMEGTRAPWNLGGGGQPTEADDVLFGEGHSMTELTDDRNRWNNLFGQTEGDRTEEVLEGLLTNSQGSPAHMIPVMNNGIHAFNLLPNHPSMVALRQGGDIAGNIQRQLVQPGQQIARTALTDERAIEITREVKEMLKRWDGGSAHRGMIDTAIGSGPGSGALTPKGLSDRIVERLSAYFDNVSLDSANAWKANEAAASPPRIRTDAERDAEAAKIRADWIKMLRGMIVQGTMKELPVPRVVVADTNWGDATEDVLFVMAPDPMTGQLKMFKQYMPEGRLVPMDAEWVDAGWQRVSGESPARPR